jgi:hypothetical protein
MTELKIEGVSQEVLEKVLLKVNELTKWAEGQHVDRWAFRASLLKALYDDADKYFESGEGTFRELASFDNGVATVLRNLKESKTKQSS